MEQKMMKALVFQGIGKLGLEKRPVPVIKEPTDAIVRVTRSTICTSDLHIRNGAVPRAREGVILGHEFAGEVVEIGSQVKTLKPGDRAAANCETICGDCWYCRRGFCQQLRAGRMDVRLRHRRLPGGVCESAPGGHQPLQDSRRPDRGAGALYRGDILSSGYWGAKLCEIKTGDTVAVIGAGPVGMCAAQSALYLGAGQVILIDPNEERLKTARENPSGRRISERDGPRGCRGCQRPHRGQRSGRCDRSGGNGGFRYSGLGGSPS